MANYYESARSNYFFVKDIEAFETELEELWQLDEEIEEKMTTNNSNTTEVINNSNILTKGK
jgi:Asp-tRNA(Asn)/Glu-tRNA(Gln) amidotransferase C subunit